MLMCHLVADTLPELHKMAYRLGISLSHYHDHHYNISQVKRANAITYGAIPITQREAASIRAAARIQWTSLP
jgi:hypothetical protein